MKRTNAARATARRFLREGCTVMDIAEPLVSFDDVREADYVRGIAEARGFVVVGVRHDGDVVGYVEHSELSGTGPCGDVLRYFGSDEVVHEDALIHEVIAGLDKKRRLFVVIGGTVGGIVSRGDLEKPPSRMWLFGLVTMVETLFVRIIERAFPDDVWREQVSPSRLQKADTLKAERERRGDTADLLDCLSFSDKGQIVLRLEDVRELFGVPSRKQGREALSRMEKLRNDLAHAQPIVVDNWDQINRFAMRLETLFTAADGWERRVTNTKPGQ